MAGTGGWQEGSHGAERFAELLFWIVGSVGLYVALGFGLVAFFFRVIVGPDSPDVTAWLWMWFWLSFVAHQVSVIGSTVVLARLFRVPAAVAVVVVVAALLLLAYPTISLGLFFVGCRTGGGSEC